MAGQTVIYRLDSWVIYPNSLLLKIDDKEFKVQDKVMQVLLSLIEANGEVVSKDEFYDKVWSDSVVTDNSLTKAISELRKIFSFSCNNGNIIETVPKKGYRIIPTVYKEKVLNKGVMIKAEKKNMLMFFSLIAFSIIAVLLVLEVIGDKESKKASSLSPNGKLITFYEKTGNQYLLMLEDMEKKEVKELANMLNPETFVVVWSSDGENLVYNATKKEDKFYSINVLSLKSLTTTFIKFAKKETEHRTKSTPKNLDSTISFVHHKEIKRGKDKIHHIYLNKRDTIKVFFQNDQIKSFSW